MIGSSEGLLSPHLKQSPDVISDDELPLQRVYFWERNHPQKVFLTQPLAGKVRDWTWQQTLDEARRMAAYLSAQGWEPGARITIFSKNCAWWIMAELAIWMAGFVTVPIYSSLRAESVNKLIEHCQPSACFLGAVEDEQAARELLAGMKCIAFPTARQAGSLNWDEMVAGTLPLPDSPLRSRDDLATIVYTSGTTGAPKGVMHRFAAFSYCVRTVLHVCGDTRDDRVLSYLPLAHIAERGAIEANALSQGTHMYFAESVETFLTDLRAARPTFFFSVPRLLIKFQQGILEKIPQAKLLRLLRIPVLSSFVKRKILQELGLSQTRVAASGAAPLPLDTLTFFRMLGLNLVEGYGMTETGITHGPQLGTSRPGTVGNTIPCVETKLSSESEILIRSPMNMLGYYRDPERTANSFTEDGFFRTGDLGSLDKDGWLRITGRLKEQFKTSKGKYVSPAIIEKLLGVDPVVENCCVMGSGMNAPFALVSLSKSARERLHDTAGRGLLERSLLDLKEKVNSQLEPHERLAFLVLIYDSWNDKNGFLTPTMKVRRAVVEARYNSLVAAWAGKREPIIWASEPVS